MRRTCITVTILIPLLGCSPKEVPQRQGTSATSTPVVVEAKSARENAIVKPCGSAPVFDLSSVPLDVIALREQGITVLELNDLRLLEFASNSAPLRFKLDNLPTGAMARTVLGVGRKSDDASLVFAEYGKAGRAGTWFHLAINMFCDYRYEYRYKPVTAPDEWVALAMTYDGTNILMYVNGELKVNRAQVIDTQPAELQICSRRSSGCISDVRIWNRSMDDREVKRHVDAALSRINDLR